MYHMEGLADVIDLPDAWNRRGPDSVSGCIEKSINSNQDGNMERRKDAPVAGSTDSFSCDDVNLSDENDDSRHISYEYDDKDVSDGDSATDGVARHRSDCGKKRHFVPNEEHEEDEEFASNQEEALTHGSLDENGFRLNDFNDDEPDEHNAHYGKPSEALKRIPRYQNEADGGEDIPVHGESDDDDASFEEGSRSGNGDDEDKTNQHYLKKRDSFPWSQFTEEPDDETREPDAGAGYGEKQQRTAASTIEEVLQRHKQRQIKTNAERSTLPTGTSSSPAPASREDDFSLQSLGSLDKYISQSARSRDDAEYEQFLTINSNKVFQNEQELKNTVFLHKRRSSRPHEEDEEYNNSNEKEEQEEGNYVPMYTDEFFDAKCGGKKKSFDAYDFSASEEEFARMVGPLSGESLHEEEDEAGTDYGGGKKPKEKEEFGSASASTKKNAHVRIYSPTGGRNNSERMWKEEGEKKEESFHTAHEPNDNTRTYAHDESCLDAPTGSSTGHREKEAPLPTTSSHTYEWRTHDDASKNGCSRKKEEEEKATNGKRNTNTPTTKEPRGDENFHTPRCGDEGMKNGSQALTNQRRLSQESGGGGGGEGKSERRRVSAPATGKHKHLADETRSPQQLETISLVEECTSGGKRDKSDTRSPPPGKAPNFDDIPIQSKGTYMIDGSPLRLTPKTQVTNFDEIPIQSKGAYFIDDEVPITAKGVYSHDHEEYPSARTLKKTGAGGAGAVGGLKKAHARHSHPPTHSSSSTPVSSTSLNTHNGDEKHDMLGGGASVLANGLCENQCGIGARKERIQAASMSTTVKDTQETGSPPVEHPTLSKRPFLRRGARMKSMLKSHKSVPSLGTGAVSPPLTRGVLGPTGDKCSSGPASLSRNASQPALEEPMGQPALDGEGTKQREFRDFLLEKFSDTHRHTTMCSEVDMQAQEMEEEAAHAASKKRAAFAARPSNVRPKKAPSNAQKSHAGTRLSVSSSTGGKNKSSNRSTVIDPYGESMADDTRTRSSPSNPTYNTANTSKRREEKKPKKDFREFYHDKFGTTHDGEGEFGSLQDALMGGDQQEKKAFRKLYHGEKDKPIGGGSTGHPSAPSGAGISERERGKKADVTYASLWNEQCQSKGLSGAEDAYNRDESYEKEGGGGGEKKGEEFDFATAPVSNSVRKYFYKSGASASSTNNTKSPTKAKKEQMEPAAGAQGKVMDGQTEVALEQKLTLLNGQIERFKKENEQCKNLRLQREQALRDTEKEREKMHEEMLAEKAHMRAEVEEEQERLRKERKRIDVDRERHRQQLAQSRADQEEVNALRQQVIDLKEEIATKDHRWKRTVERLQRQNDELKKKNQEAQDEITWAQQTKSPTRVVKTVIPTSKSRPSVTFGTIGPPSRKTTATALKENRPQYAEESTKLVDKLIEKDPKLQQRVAERREIALTRAAERKENDGRVEQVFADGRRELNFPNGLKKVIYADGSQTVHFANGDTKECTADGTVVYHYSQTQATQTTLPDGTEILKFQSGQVETHYPDKRKKIVFPNGTLKTIAADLTEKIYIGGIGAPAD